MLIAGVELSVPKIAVGPTFSEEISVIFVAMLSGKARL